MDNTIWLNIALIIMAIINIPISYQWMQKNAFVMLLLFIVMFILAQISIISLKSERGKK